MSTLKLVGWCCIAFTVTGCATTPRSNARYWKLEQCSTAPSLTVRFNRPDGTVITTIPRETCQRLDAATKKIQSVANYDVKQVFISDDEQPNAFASLAKDGKPIAAVTIGMLSAVKSDEAAWAGLMGHEIAHHVKRHREGRKSAKGASEATGNVVANVISMAVPGVGGVIGGMVGGTVAQNAVYGAYTRPQEAEADELGLRWMVEAGYDPRGLSRLFESLGKNSSVPAFLSTHPASDDRARMVETFIASRPNLVAGNAAPQLSIAQPVGPVAARNCEDSTSEIRLKTLCLSTDGCEQEIRAITKFCSNARNDSCVAARDQLPTYCNRVSKAYSDRACDAAVSKVRVYCRE